MKCGRKYILPFSTLFVALFFVVLGATLPYLASQMQDAQISKFQKKMKLSGINLTLRQEGDVGATLQLMSGRGKRYWPKKMPAKRHWT